MPKSEEKPTIITREIFRDGFSTDKRALHKTFIEQVIENTKLLMEMANFRPLVLPDHPPEDKEERQVFFDGAKAMGWIQDIAAKEEDGNGFIVGGQLKLSTSFAKEYNEDDYPFASVGFADRRVLPSGEIVGPHIDHVAIFGHKHPAFHNLQTESKYTFTSIGMANPVPSEKEPVKTKESYAMNPEKMQMLKEAMMKCVEMLSEGDEESVVVEEEMTEEEDKEKQMTSKKDYAEGEEEKKDDAFEKKEDESSQYAAKINGMFKMTLESKAKELGVPKNKITNFTSIGMDMFKSNNDPERTIKNLDEMFSGQFAANKLNGQESALITDESRGGPSKFLPESAYEKHGISRATLNRVFNNRKEEAKN